MKAYILTLSFVVTCLTLLFSCRQEDINNAISPEVTATFGAKKEHFYGMAFPEKGGPTRGATQRENLWYLLAGGTNRTNPVALSGRHVVELRPDQCTDRVIGYLPENIGDPLVFLSNADQTILYIATHEIREYNGVLYREVPMCRLKVNH